ncbi:MAG: hypothetical protein ACKV2T_38535 [Kofleriaceae bacterium]
MVDTPKRGLLQRIFSEVAGIAILLGSLVVLAAILVGVAWWQGWISIGGTRGPGSKGSIENGASCSRDRDCVSGICARNDKRCLAPLRTGDACTRDAECASNDCRFASVASPRETCR